MANYASLLFTPEEYHQIGPFRFRERGFSSRVPEQPRGMAGMGERLQPIGLGERFDLDGGGCAGHQRFPVNSG